MWRLFQIGIACILALVLTACGGQPKSSVVEQAIALQVSQVQQDLVGQLYRHTTVPPDFTVKRVQVEQRRSLKIEDKPGYQIQGTYTLVLNFPGHRVTQPENPFEIYLQREPQEKRWNLARLRIDNTEQSWEILPLPSPQPADEVSESDKLNESDESGKSGKTDQSSEPGASGESRESNGAEPADKFRETATNQPDSENNLEQPTAEAGEKIKDSA
jgi:hypothetical protein